MWRACCQELPSHLTLRCSSGKMFGDAVSHIWPVTVQASVESWSAPQRYAGCQRWRSMGLTSTPQVLGVLTSAACHWQTTCSLIRKGVRVQRSRESVTSCWNRNCNSSAAARGHRPSACLHEDGRRRGYDDGVVRQQVVQRVADRRDEPARQQPCTFMLLREHVTSVFL